MRRLFAHNASFVVCAAAALVAMHSSAFAHPGHGEGLLAGLSHPFSGIDHLLAMVAVGLWAAQLGRPAIWVLPAVFPAAMALGAALGVYGVPLPGVEAGIIASVIVLGAAVALGWRLTLPVCATAVGVFALFHGHAHGTELPLNASALLYGLGFVLATLVLHAAGIYIGLITRTPLFLRTAGGAIAAIGLVLIVAH